MTGEQFKRILGFRSDNNLVYVSLRAEIKAYMDSNGIRNKTEAGEDKWATLKAWVLGHRFVRPALNKYLFQSDEKTKENVRILNTAIHNLCLSCSKSLQSSQRSLEQSLLVLGNNLFFTTTDSTTGPRPTAPTTTVSPIAVPPTAVPTTPPTATPTTPPTTAPPTPTTVAPLETKTVLPPAPTSTSAIRGRTIRVRLCDPEMFQEVENYTPWTGNAALRTYSVIPGDSSYSELRRACLKHIPEGRSLDEILGAASDSPEPREVLTLSDDEEVEAWLAETAHVQQLRVLAILAKRPKTLFSLVSVQLIGLKGGSERRRYGKRLLS